MARALSGLIGSPAASFGRLVAAYSAASASAAAAAATAAASGELNVALNRLAGLIVEDVEGRQADIGNFFLTESDLIAISVAWSE